MSKKTTRERVRVLRRVLAINKTEARRRGAPPPTMRWARRELARYGVKA